MANETGQPMDERRTAAWIGKALRIEGRIVSAETLNIDGSVEGTIEVGDHNLNIGPGAAVKADLIAKTVSISGEVTGNVMASEKVTPPADWIGGRRYHDTPAGDGRRGHYQRQSRGTG